MNWIFVILGAVAIGAAILAIYERRKARHITFDALNTPPHDSPRAAYSNAERIRAEGVALQNPGNAPP